MNSTLFEQYEAQRNRYKPGTIWKDKGSCLIKRLVLIERPSSLMGICHMHGTTREDLLFFEVLSSDAVRDEDLFPGKIVSWAKPYMELQYEVEK